MNHTEMADNISTNLEIERSRLGLTQAQFAEKLEMSLSSYKRIINCETTKLDVYTAYLVYKITESIHASWLATGTHTLM